VIVVASLYLQFIRNQSDYTEPKATDSFTDFTKVSNQQSAI